ncbi:protein EURL homolog [Scleropages formosus]|uniref:Chromosome 21 open reading frame 91 n=1 Tax=Scleropages formosus TaxID=113540 RepID=A0A8D0CB90_SCLFO|nr:protein EURL homolog [Scleropages formosus]XP_018610654.1 protein EURL homolog [Scleropages formosus]
MNEEEQFVNIDLNDDNICSVCKLETDTSTLSFCHVCFELSIEGMPSSTLLHSKSLRGHRDCFEKYHLIANQKLSRTKGSRSTYEGVKNALSRKISRIIQYAQNKEAVSEAGHRGDRHQLLCYSKQGDRNLVPQTDSHVPRYTPRWREEAAAGVPDYAKGMLGCHTVEELGLATLGDEDSPLCPQSGLWPGETRGLLCAQQQGGGTMGVRQCRNTGHSHEELTRMSVEELHQLNGELLLQLQKVFEELTVAVQEKDALASELHVRHIAIEQLFKNCAKLPWLQISRAGVKTSNPPVE